MINCKEKPREKKPQDKIQELYSVIDELLRLKFQNVDAVILELSITPSKYVTKIINEQYKLLDSLEADYMSNQYDSTKHFTLDSLKVNKRTLTYSQLFPLFKKFGADSTYRILKEKKIRSFIQFSIPLLSKDENKMILETGMHCGDLCGGGRFFLLEKRNEKWKIIYEGITWVS